ncbi:helix-turn-helix domain-containing protein [Exiguobacterium sp. A1_3_1]|uniref:helix-turn-helix domain-containing protein n=1 Tax=Exiguobacterium sp. A1_3_1 TaxID=2651871 RepID=UPI003B980926
MSTLGLRIKERRKAIGLTQSDLAGAELSSGMVSLIERDMTNPSLKTLEHLAKTLEVSVNYLLNQEEAELSGTEDAGVLLRKTEGLLRVGKHEEAQKMIDELDQTHIPASLKGRYLKLQGELAIERAEYGRAIDCLNNALLYLDSSVMDEYIDTFYHLAKSHLNASAFSKSIDVAMQGMLLLDSLPTNKNILLRLQLMYVQAYGYARLKSYEKAMEIIEDALDYMQKTNCFYNESLFRMLNGLAALYMKDYEKGIKHTKMALALFEENKQSEYVTGCMTNLGILLRESGDLNQSIDYLEQSVALAEQNDSQWNIVNSSLELATSYFRLNQWSEAKSLCERHIQKVDPEDALQVKMRLLLAQIEYEDKQYEQAKRWSDDALVIVERLEERQLLAKTLTVHAQILIEQHQEQQAIEYLLRSNQIYENLL